jgi:hypothetical protein
MKKYRKNSTENSVKQQPENAMKQSQTGCEIAMKKNTMKQRRKYCETASRKYNNL